MNLKAMNKKQLLIIIGNMKKDELIQIITNMNITITLVKPTKKDLIQIICKE